MPEGSKECKEKGRSAHTRATMSPVKESAARFAGKTRLSLAVADCTDFLAALPDDSVDLIITDPAYSGMNNYLKLGRGRIVGEYKDAGEEGAKWFPEFIDNPPSFSRFLTQCQRVLRNNRHVYIMFDSYSFISLAPLVRNALDVKNVIVWDKMHIGMGHYFRRRHELILFASKGRRSIPSRGMADIWEVPRIVRPHYPTQKPVALFSRMIECSAEPGFTVCDPFVGSGSSAVAALLAGCNFIGADISSRAVDIANDRCTELLATGIDPLEKTVQLASA